jgi:hypothetical protein
MDDLEIDLRAYLDGIDWPTDLRPDDWRRYVSEEVRGLWKSFTYEQRLATAQSATLTAWQMCGPQLTTPTWH